MSTAAHNQNIGSAKEILIYNASAVNVPSPSEFLIRCRSGSPADILVRIPGLHAEGDLFRIPIGESQVFRVRHQGITEVYAISDGVSSDIDFGAVSITTQ